MGLNLSFEPLAIGLSSLEPHLFFLLSCSIFSFFCASIYFSISWKLFAPGKILLAVFGSIGFPEGQPPEGLWLPSTALRTDSMASLTISSSSSSSSTTHCLSTCTLAPVFKLIEISLRSFLLDEEELVNYPCSKTFQFLSLQLRHWVQNRKSSWKM